MKTNAVSYSYVEVVVNGQIYTEYICDQHRSFRSIRADGCLGFSAVVTWEAEDTPDVRFQKLIQIIRVDLISFLYSLAGILIDL